MIEKNEAEHISYDRMKEQIEKEVFPLLNDNLAVGGFELPKFGCERGITQISFPIPRLNEMLLFQIVDLIKKHLENVRIHSFGDGYYAFQAMNKSLFKSENMLDNYKVELFGLSNFKIDISKKGNFSQEEINLTIEIFKICFASNKEDPSLRLKKLGASIYYADANLNWDYIAGYEDVKRKIKETIIMPLQNGDIYDSIAHLTRKVFESNRPRAVLFEGPPGVGKTTIARIISTEVNIPLIYVPVESIMSKWYGQSSQNLAQIFDAADELGGSILFIDEIDSLAGSRDQNMFEATRRILSVLLRRMDGLGSLTNTILIGATNRKIDLDHALISRFDQSINFPLPNSSERSSIFANYARHLDKDSLAKIGDASEGMSGRNIKDVCEMTERSWARKLIIQKEDLVPPSPDYYLHNISSWHIQ